jgi:hypothetical protein
LDDSDDSDDSEKIIHYSVDHVKGVDAHLVKLCRDGGVNLQKFLLSKAFSPPATEKSPKEWQFRDILKTPEVNLWKQACIEEMEALKRCKV